MCYKTFISGVISRFLAWGCFRPERPQALGLAWNVGDRKGGGGLGTGKVSPTPVTPTPWCPGISYLGSALVSVASLLCAQPQGLPKEVRLGKT